jgi:hypothetical protein
MVSSRQFGEKPTHERNELNTEHCTSRQLLRALMRRPNAQSREGVELLLEGFKDWGILLDLAQEHRVTQIVFAQLRNMELEIPENVYKLLRAQYEQNALHSLVSAAELIALLRVFDRESIQAMPIKGVVLAVSIYGDLAARSAGDLDLLVRYHDLSRATTIMVERGYELITAVRADGMPVDDSYFEYKFVRPTDGMFVELRWRLDLADSRFKRDLGINWVWPTRRTALIAGAEVPNISPTNTLLLLCMHGSKHLWSRLLWMCDVAQLLEVERELNWDLAIREAKRLGLWRCVALGVLLAHRVLGAAVPEDVLKGFESDAGFVLVGAVFPSKRLRCSRHSSAESRSLLFQIAWI